MVGCDTLLTAVTVLPASSLWLVSAFSGSAWTPMHAASRHRTSVHNLIATSPRAFGFGMLPLRRMRPDRVRQRLRGGHSSGKHSVSGMRRRNPPPCRDEFRVSAHSLPDRCRADGGHAFVSATG